VHLVGFTVEIYYDVRSYERQVFRLTRGKFVSSFFHGFIRIIVHTIYFRDLDTLSLTYELYASTLLGCQLFS